MTPAAGAAAPTRRSPGRLLVLWAGFTAVHAWLALAGLVVRPESTYDVELYRRWVEAGVAAGSWPVLDVGWVYPVGALLPISVPAPLADSPGGYALAWFGLVTALDAVAVAVLLHATPRGEVGAWWWLGALAALGPVALGRLDGVVAPLVVVALASARRRPALASVLLTIGAWIKVAPGAVVAALAVTARRPWRTVALPAAVVSGLLAGAALAAGAGWRVLSFLSTQGGRDLQIESVAATPFSVARLWGTGIWAELDTGLNTFEVAGPDTRGLAGALDALLVALVAAITWLAWRAVRDGAERIGTLILAAFALQLALVVANKVGSPQFLAWLLPPVAVALAWHGWAAPWRVRATLVLVAAALTQWLFPFAYVRFLWAESPFVLAAAVRNLLLGLLLVEAVVALVRLGARDAVARPGAAGGAATVTR